MEVTAWGRVNGAGHSSLQDDPFLFYIGIGDRSRGEQGFSVRVKGSAKDRFGRVQFNHLAQVHHGDAVTNVLNHTQIMGDEEVCETKFTL